MSRPRAVSDVDDARWAPVQGETESRLGPARPRGVVAWWEHELSWQDYARRYGTQQSAERIAERGGFGFNELTDHLGHEPTTWEPR